MPLYRKKPIVVDAEQYLGQQSCPMRGVYRTHDGIHYVITAQRQSVHLVQGDWVILEKEQGGEFILAYPCKDSVFVSTYEAIDDSWVSGSI